MTKKNITALVTHEKNNNHTFDYNKTRILNTEINLKKREFLEMIQIQKNKNAINEKKDVDKLSRIYTPIL